MERRALIVLVLCLMFCLSISQAATSDGALEGSLVVARDFTVLQTGGAAKEAKILKLPFNGVVTTTNPFIAAQDSDTEMVSLLTAQLYGYIPREDGNGSYLVPMLANDEPVDINGDGKVWRIGIREGAKWENGSIINADTFMFSWKMCLDPVLLVNSAGAFANTYVDILNATAYFSQASTGVAVDWEDVGVKKIDDKTLEISLTSDFSGVEVMRHFATQGSSPIYQPLFEAGMNDARTETTYGSELSQIVSCGPFSLIEWVKGSEYLFEKNENYVRADLIKLDGITYRTIEERGTQQQMFEAGELDSTLLDTAGIAKYSEDPRFTPARSIYIRMMDICDTNPTQPILANANFKKALFYGIDRVTIAKLAGKMAATWVVPHTSVAYADGTAYRDLEIAKEFLPENYGYDPEYAKECFDIALAETNIDSVELSITYSSTSADHKVITEFLQESLSELFGDTRFKLNLNAMPNAQSLEVRKSSPTNPLAYELGLGDWAPSAGTYNSTKHVEPYTSIYTRKNAPYHNERLDALYMETQLSANRKDEKRLAELTAAMEKVIIEDVVTIPILENRTYYLFSDRILLPVNSNDSGIGWGFRFADIAQ